MQLQRGTETITYPLEQWQQWSHPTLTFLQAQGFEVLPPPVEVTSPVPAVVTMRQARLTLLRTGLLAAVDVAVTAIGGELAITWEYAAEVERTNPLVEMLSAQFGWTEQQLDELFTMAAGI